MATLGFPALLFASWQAYQNGEPPLEEVGPVTLVLMGVTHLLWRVPYTRFRPWEIPLLAFSVGLAWSGGFLFTPSHDERSTAFSVFFATYLALALSYGHFCASTAKDSPWRRGVIEPLKKVFAFGIPGFDIGMVLAPFAFPLFLLRYYLVSRRAL